MDYLDQPEENCESKPLSKFLLSKSSPVATITLHSSFKEVILDEWDKPDKENHINRNYLRFCTIQGSKIPITDIPKVDAVVFLTRDILSPQKVSSTLRTPWVEKWRPLSKKNHQKT